MRKKNQKEKEKTLEKERKVLRETLNIVVKENAELKEILADIQGNVNENKLQLQEKINSITDKDTAVEMLTNQIDMLKQKFNELQQTRQKMQSLLNNNYVSDDNLNTKGNDTITIGTPNQLRHKNIDNIRSKKDKENKMKIIRENIEKERKFLENQQDLQKEINNLKRDVFYLKEKINEKKGKYFLYQNNCNIQDYFQKNELNDLQKMLNNNNQNDKLMYLVTNTGNVFKIKKRNDLSKTNFINQIDLDYFKKYKGNEVINIREKPDINDKNLKECPQKYTLYNNNFNNNLEHIIKYSINPNYNCIDSDDSYGEVETFSQSAEVKDSNLSSRNKTKQKGINSYVTDLLRASFMIE